jgi:hypothetical protein
VIPAYIDARLRELAALERGWYGHDGVPGEPISTATIVRVGARFDGYISAHVYLFPMPDGGISAEWTNEDYDDEVFAPAEAPTTTKKDPQ